MSLRAESRRLGFPLDPALKIFDERGKQLAQADDVSGGRDAELAFHVPADGRYRLSIRDFASQGGPRYVYRLDIMLAEPEFELKLPADSLAITPGKPGELTVDIDRRNGFAEEIGFEVLELPRGITVEPAKSLAKGDSAKTVRLRFSAAEAPSQESCRLLASRPADARRRLRPRWQILPCAHRTFGWPPSAAVRIRKKRSRTRSERRRERRNKPIANRVAPRMWRWVRRGKRLEKRPAHDFLAALKFKMAVLNSISAAVDRTVDVRRRSEQGNEL